MEREHFLEIFKIKVDEIILPYVADRLVGFLCLGLKNNKGF